MKDRNEQLISAITKQDFIRTAAKDPKASMSYAAHTLDHLERGCTTDICLPMGLEVQHLFEAAISDGNFAVQLLKAWDRNISEAIGDYHQFGHGALFEQS